MFLPLAVLASSKVVIEGEAPMQDLNQLQLKAEVGKVNIEGGKTDRVRWRVELEPKGGWFTSAQSVQEKLKGIRVVSEIDGNILSLKLDYPPGVDHDDCKQNWEVELPAVLGLNVKHGVGSLHVAGLTGGVDVESGVGEVKVDVPAGGVRAKVGVGDVNVVSATGSLGDIDLHAGVGDASARVAGKDLAARRAGPEAKLSYTNDGDDNYRLSADVGNVQLRVEN
ncbi:MAG TPA: hypothetical protein VF268_12560 [Gammaproteobacteria bacterium]